jgi:hypothetical protein
MISLFKINNTFNFVFKQRKKKKTKELIRRFYKIFNDHSIPATEIPNLIPEITLDTLEKDTQLLSILTNEMIDRISELFKIKPTWLRGNSSTMYETQFCYKQPHRFFEKLSKIEKRDFDSPVIAITSTKELNYDKNYIQLVCLIFREPIYQMNDKVIDRYYIWSDAWNWGYWKTRCQLKALARLTFYDFKSGPIPVYYVNDRYAKGIKNGKIVPHKIIMNAKELAFNLEDFADSSTESRVAKEEVELPYVLQYIKSHKLDELIRQLVKRN